MIKNSIAILCCVLALFGSLSAKPVVADFLMPEDHPIKSELDRFFGQKRWIFNEKNFKKAGFTSYHPREFSRVIVAKHSNFPGYVFKVYLDTQRYHGGNRETQFWLWRCEGARLIRTEIEANGWEAYFKVPVKWIYRLPLNPKAPKGYLPKHTILVQEDMDILSDPENLKAWKSEHVTFELLEKLHYILKTVGLSDCSKIPNIPIAKDGRIAFIDTQSYNQKNIPWEDLNDKLNPNNRTFWKTITDQK